MIIWVFSLIIVDNSLTGKKPPDEIIDNDKLKASKVLKFKVLNNININNVNDE